MQFWNTPQDCLTQLEFHTWKVKRSLVPTNKKHTLLQICVFKLVFKTKSDHIFNHIKQWKKLDVIKTNKCFLTQMWVKLYD
jgi:hypothetical protein